MYIAEGYKKRMSLRIIVRWTHPFLLYLFYEKCEIEMQFTATDQRIGVLFYALHITLNLR